MLSDGPVRGHRDIGGSEYSGVRNAVTNNLPLDALRAVNAYSLGHSAPFLPLAPRKVASGRFVGVDSSGRNTRRL